ncbi:MAG: DUF1844 domain-containing protein [Phycisphaerales bacterium]|nr:MAG: DUF1844 domain-containing protein [Phycisphaerales bacterium]
MTETGEGLHIDSDWKEEARREKERLAEQSRQGRGELPPPSFAEIVNLIVIQAAMALGGFVGPDGRAHPPDLVSGRHYIDLLGLMEEKTRGNLTPEEQQMLEAVLYELRMQFVAFTQPPGRPAAGRPPAADGAGSKLEMP